MDRDDRARFPMRQMLSPKDDATFDPLFDPCCCVRIRRLLAHQRRRVWNLVGKPRRFHRNLLSTSFNQIIGRNFFGTPWRATLRTRNLRSAVYGTRLSLRLALHPTFVDSNIAEHRSWILDCRRTGAVFVDFVGELMCITCRKSR